MPTLEEAYYEFDGFWNPATTPLQDEDRARAVAVITALPRDVTSVLDAGCGSGIFANELSRRRPDLPVLGIDRSQGALRYTDVPKLLGNLTHLPFRSRGVDCVTALEVLEHLPIPVFDAAVAEIGRVARRFILVGVPNRQDLRTGQTECSACHTRFNPDLHLRSFDDERLGRLFHPHEFACRSVAPMGREEQLRWLSQYSALRNHQGDEPMASPLCPICGFENADFLAPSDPPGGGDEQPTPVPPTGGGALVGLKTTVKRMWPRTTRHRWLLAVYERSA